MSASSSTTAEGRWVGSLVDKEGAFQRKASSFRNWITVDGKGEGGFVAAGEGRYHLYVSLACPWAHRTIILRAMKGLTKAIGMTVVDPKNDFAAGKGWSFRSDQLDPIHGFHHLAELYTQSQPDYDGRFTVPVLYDTKTKTIVNNESSEIIQMINNAFNAFCETKEQSEFDLYPTALRAKIDEVNEWVYTGINNGVYKCGFARSQEAYNEAFTNLFNSLDKVEAVLSKSRYLASNTHLTLADIRLFTTVLRFEPVYYAHFKCNQRHLFEFPNVWNFLRELYQMPTIQSTCNIDEIKVHYYWSQITVNPTRIVPQGPAGLIDEMKKPHDRSRFQ